MSEEAQEWVHSKPEPTRRRWLMVEQLNQLYGAAHGRERVVLALEIFNASDVSRCSDCAFGTWTLITEPFA